jgi:hypothetical protein
MKSINHTDLCEYLRQYQSVFLGFVSETIPNFKKGGRGATPPFTIATGRKPELYRKITEGVVLIGTAPDYAKLVRNRLAKNGKEDMEEGKRTWGERKDAIEVVHTNKEGVTKHYITFHFVANNQPKVRYTYDGYTVQLTNTEKEYLKGGSSSQKQEKAGLSEEQQIIHREYEVSNIKSITVSGQTIPVV